MTGSPFGAARCSLPRNLDGRRVGAQAAGALRAAVLQIQIRAGGGIADVADFDIDLARFLGMLAAAAAFLPALRPQIETLQPAALSACAMPRPMPPLPPVITAVRPERSKMLMDLSWLCAQ